MVDVTVAQVGAGAYAVTTSGAGRTTTHTVRVPARLPETLGCTHVPVDELVRRSFMFLLEREPATAILQTFSLEQIGDYFPDYPDTMRRLLGRADGGGARAGETDP
jgi:hypothetical protein